MSEVHEAATVSLIMADYAVADQLGKLQMIGGGLQIIGRDHSTGATAAFAIVVSLGFPAEVFNEQYAFEVILEDVMGSPVSLGDDVTGDGGVMRFGQSQQVEEPTFPGAGVPRRSLPARTQVVIHFNNGLPLPAGQVLRWRVRIDGETKPDWVLLFFVAPPAALPVIG